MKGKLYILFFLIGIHFCAAQVIEETNTDILLKEGISLYREQKFDRALEFTNKGLELAPDYHDIRVLRIRILQNQKKTQQAREDLNYLLKEAPEYNEVKKIALRQVNLMEPQEGLEFIKKLTSIYPKYSELEVMQMQVLFDQGNPDEARSLALNLNEREGLTGDQRYQLNNILKATVKNEVGINYQLIDFSKAYNRDNWQNFFFEYQHNISKTSLLGRITHSDRGRGSIKDQLYEIEAYPVINNKLYFFGNIGFSAGELFPDYKTSASVFYSFAKGFEGEAGGKLLSYNEKEFFTGVFGITHYTGKFYLNLRAALGPERLSQMIQNYQFNVRYYFKGSDNYLFSRLSRGISPDDSLLFVQVQENPELEAYFAGTGINFLLELHHIIRLDAGFLFEDTSTGKKGRQFLLALGYRYRF